MVIVNQRQHEWINRSVNCCESLLSKNPSQGGLKTDLCTHKDMNGLMCGRVKRSDDLPSAHNKMKIATSNEFSYKIKGRITGLGVLKT